MYDAIVIGGGPGGLQAALTLGRTHRRTLVLDSGEYHNAPADAMHNFLSRDGTPPDVLRASVHAELAQYADVNLVRAVAVSVSGQEGSFAVVTADGAEHRSALVLLATGVRDVLPGLPGLRELFGTVVAHCPFCHGHEFARGRIAIQAGPTLPGWR